MGNPTISNIDYLVGLPNEKPGTTVSRIKWRLRGRNFGFYFESTDPHPLTPEQVEKHTAELTDGMCQMTIAILKMTDEELEDQYKSLRG